MQNGQQFGTYHIVSLLRQSAVSSLYLAAPSLSDSARVVLKVFHNPLLDDQQRQQFWREAEQLQHLRHPHIVPLLDARIHADTNEPYLVSDYVTGGSLLQHLQQSSGQKLSRDKGLSILRQIGDALHYAHQQQIVHYHLKPSNILLNAQGNALLTDFGISCISTQSHNSDEQHTPPYLAPECLEGAAISKLSNQYALGCIAYELLSGQTFFSAATSNTDTSPLAQIQPEPALQPLLDAQVSPKVAQAIVTALHRDRLCRHNNIATFLEQLPSLSSPVEEASVPQQGTLVKQWKDEILKLYGQKQYEQALPLLEQVIHHEPQNVMVYVLKAQCLLSLHRYEEVVTTCDQALQLEAVEEADVSQILYQMKSFALSWSGRHQEAIDAFDKVLQFDAEDISLYKQKIESLAHLGRYEEVVTTAEQALRIDAGNAHLLRAKGIALVQLKRYDDALQALEPATLLNSEDSRAYLNKGIALMQLRRYEEALETLDQALSHAPDDLAILLAKCAVLNALEHHEEAIALCEPILSQDPTCLPALLSKGHALFLLKRYGEAVAAFDQIISLTPTDIDVYHTKAKALVGLGRLTEALDTLEQALTLDPENALTYYNKGFILGLGQTGRDVEAAEAIQRAYTLAPYLVHEPPPQLDFPSSQADSGEEDTTLKIESIDSRSLSPALVTETPSEPVQQEEQEGQDAITDPTVYINRGTLLNKAGRFEEALANFEQALLLDSGPACALAYGGKAAALSEIGTPRATLEACNQFLRFESDHPTVSPGIYLIMATALQKVQRFDEALQAYDKAATLLPTLSDAYMGKGNLLRQLQRLEEALEAYNQALRAEPGYVAALRNKGTVLDELGRLDEALEAFNQSIRLDPNHVKGHVSKAAILYEMQRFDEAVAAHSYALRLGQFEAKSNISKEEALEMLKQEHEFNVRLRELLYSRGSDPASNVERGRALVALPLPEEAIMPLLDAAIIAFEQALSLDPNHRDALFYKGVALLVRKQPEDALDAFERILSLQPYDFEACLQKGKALQSMQRLEEALSAFTEALAIRDDVDTYRQKIDLLCELKRFEEALDLIDHVCTLDPGNVLDYLRKAGLLAYIQRPEEALAWYEKAINLQGIPDRALALAHSSRAELLCQLQNYEAALADFNYALQLVHDDEELLLNKGLLLRHMQRHDEARGTLYQVILSNPEILENMDEELAEDLIEYLNLSEVFAQLEEYIAQGEEQEEEEED